MNCSACSAPDAIEVGEYRPYSDYKCTIYDCNECGCRFTPRDPEIYERLHAAPQSSYAVHAQFAEECHRLFEAGDIEGLSRWLCAAGSKNAFVISEIEQSLRGNGCVLEIGCSRGYLTSFFIAKGYDTLGVDVSESAVEGAAELFGDHFATEIPEDGQFDAIYHVGTIGCVAEPAGMTRSLIDRLRPGGILVFNAPNAETARALGEVWVPNTSPPDLVTLFEERFWTEQFADVADARVRVEPTPPGAAQAFWKRRKRGESVLRPGTTPLIGDSAESGSSAIQPRPRQSQVSKLIRRLVRPLISVTVKFGWPRYLPSESGLFVVLTRKSE